MNKETPQHTPEEYIQMLRNIAQSLTGVDPMEGRIITPIQPVSEEDTQRFLNEFFRGKEGE